MPSTLSPSIDEPSSLTLRPESEIEEDPSAPFDDSSSLLSVDEPLVPVYPETEPSPPEPSVDKLLDALADPSPAELSDD